MQCIGLGYYIIVVKSYGNISESRVVETIPLVVLVERCLLRKAVYHELERDGMTKRALFLMGC